MREKRWPTPYGEYVAAGGRRGIVSLLGAAAALALLGAAHVANTLPLTVASPLTPFARLADLLLLGGLLLLAGALGLALLARLGLELPGLEGAALACALGLGAIAYLLLGLGWLGLYRPPLILTLLLVLALLVRRRLRLGLAWVGGSLATLSRLRREGYGEWAVLPLVVLLGGGFLLALLGALTPPHHYDPLTYHLVLPQRFLQTGHVGPVPDIVGSELPLTVELLYGVGLAWGSDAFAQLLHLAFAGLTAAALWGATRRWFDRTTAWLALALFLGTPLVFVWARVADNDLAVGCFLLLTLIAALRAADEAALKVARRWLALAGIFAGLALSTKYQTAPALVPLGLWVLVRPWHDAARPGWSRTRLWQNLGGAALFAGVAALVAAPWYVRNLPFLFSLAQALFASSTLAPGTVGQEPDLGVYLLHGLAISPRTPLGYLLLPLRAYIRGDFEQRFVVPNPLFLLLPFLIVLPGWRRSRVVVLAVAMAGSFAVIWALGVQELRYLLAVCPLLALGVAGVLRAAWQHVRLRPLVRGGLLVSAVLTLLLTFLHVGADRPLAVTLGLESRDAYLRQSITFGATYRATSFLATTMAPDEQVLFINEVQTYYLPAGLHARTIDARNVMYTLVERYATPEDAVAALREQQIRYLLVNDADLRWWMQADSSGRVARVREAFGRITAQLVPVYQDGPAARPHITIYRVPDTPSVAVKTQ